jgi:hypothetical protein
VYEVRDSKPLLDSITSNPTGIVTFAEPESGRFLFKFRPKPGVSQIFGRLPSIGELQVWITDREVRVMNGDVPMVTLRRNQFSSIPIGIEVGVDGTVGIGVNHLPDGMVLTD